MTQYKEMTNMTSTNKDILGERTALEETIASYEQQIDIRCDGEDDGSCWDGESLGAFDHGITIGQARTRVALLESILAKYRMLEKAAEQYKNPPNISERARFRMLSSAQMIRSVRELLTNVNLDEQSAMAIKKGALLILDSAIELLEWNDL